MPTYQFIITIIGGTWNGNTIIKFTEQEKNTFVDLVRAYYGLECSVEKIEMF